MTLSIGIELIAEPRNDPEPLLVQTEPHGAQQPGWPLDAGLQQEVWKRAQPLDVSVVGAVQVHEEGTAFILVAEHSITFL